MGAFDAVAFRRRLHTIPEVGLDLPDSQEAVLAALAPLPLEIHRSGASSSFLAVLRGGAAAAGVAADPAAGRRRAVLLRADMDALPVVERSGVPFASTNGAMHACGHDLHTAALVGAAHALAARADTLPGDVVFVFQAGEEAVNGARVLLEEGLLDRPDVDYLAGFALHVRANLLPGGVFASRAGSVTADGTSIAARFTGRGGHGSAPHQATDPVPALVAALQGIPVALGRGIDAFEPVVFTAGSVHAGTRRNVIPDTAEFDATLRTVDAATRDHAIAIVRRVVAGAALMHGVQDETTVSAGYPAVVNDPAEHDAAVAIARELFGADAWQPLAHADTMTEDFSRFAQRMPSTFLFLGAAPAGTDPAAAAANHAADAVFDDGVLARAIALETAWAVARLEHHAALASTPSPEGTPA